MGHIFFRRSFVPLYHSEILYSLSPLGREQQKILALLHGLTRSVIRKRKQEFLLKSKHEIGQEDHEDLGEEF
jgi:hypothetical protein